MRRVVLVVSLLLAVFAFISAYSQDQGQLDKSIQQAAYSAKPGS